jgi:hypothetical protein
VNTTKLRPYLLFLARALLIALLLGACYRIGVAHAAPAEAPPATPTTDPPGPITWGLVLALGIALGNVLSRILDVVAPRTKWTGDDKIRDFMHALMGLANQLPQSAAALRGAPAPTTTIVTVQQPPAGPPGRTPQSGRTSLLMVSAIAFVVTLVLGSLATFGCGARQRISAGVGAFIDCEAEHIDAGLLAEAKAVSKSAVQRWISGDGSIDTAGIKAEAAPLKSDLMRCGFIGALAALANPPAPLPGAPASAPLVADPGELRATIASVHADLGWGPVKLPGGAVL